MAKIEKEMSEFQIALAEVAAEAPTLDESQRKAATSTFQRLARWMTKSLTERKELQRKLRAIARAIKGAGHG